MGKQTNGGSKVGVSAGGIDKTTKKRDLLTKGEKLIILRNALFDDDPGGFGAERDVSRWLAAPFRSFQKNGLDVSIEFSHGEALIGQELADLVDLAAVFAEEVEEDAGREYHPEDKEEHLTEDAARFLLARDNSDSGETSGKVVGFAHFRFTLHGELADEMEGDPCLFLYDLHVSEACQRKGLARHLVSMLELIGRRASMSEMVLPLPKSDLAEPAKAFVLQGLNGWALDCLAMVAPDTAKALKKDGSLQVFVKQLKPREVEVDPVAEAEAAAAEAAATAEEAAVAEAVVESTAEAAAGSEVQEDDWGLASAPATPPPKKKSNGKKKSTGKKGKKAPAPSPTSVANPIPLVLEEPS